jgi:hypothetical protein
LAAFSIECALKAFLARKGFSQDVLRKAPFRHDLITLWAEADKQGLQMSAPSWLANLQELSAGPGYLVRYPTKYHAMQFPNPNAVVEGTKQLLAKIG